MNFKQLITVATLFLPLVGWTLSDAAPGEEATGRARDTCRVPEEDLRCLDLDEQLLRWRVIAERKLAVGQDLARGRLTLLAAAGLIREIDRQNPDFDHEAFQLIVRPKGDGEWYCRYAIGLAERPSNDPDRRRVLAGLEDELQRLLEAEAVTLPSTKEQ
ncbi:hypothetical protein [Limnoglobus roseus]|uniref:Uncharacterized protein n=1 Tax=Limnoglobus roseus TaxID=2598579 RepID=A0A5C1AH30_9BACT|nr:hypothetical protein [Limnoglobus roseus]QEL16268.1 hypothetical protein PX52LOC_03209 [Limnoglobus roseus]